MGMMMPADGFEPITFIPIGYVENDFDSSGQWKQMEYTTLPQVINKLKSR